VDQRSAANELPDVPIEPAEFLGNGLHCCALLIVLAIFKRLRTIPSSCIRLRTFFAL